uniref:Chitin-binding type-2 domain-containing protein n=1 Tax=Rhabditophanes sp. KR3021 TaxID=114890 RepID=A0AC35U5R4_9BILA
MVNWRSGTLILATLAFVHLGTAQQDIDETTTEVPELIDSPAKQSIALAAAVDGRRRFTTTTTTTESPQERRRRPRPTTTQAPTTPPNFQREINERRALNCRKLGDGNWVFGCSDYFWTCRDNNAFRMNCPANLYFNPSRNQCQYEQNVELCTDPELRESMIPKQAIPEFSCEGKRNGFYTKGYCDGNYLRCHDGFLTNHRCPSELEFDVKKSACVYKNDVSACKNLRRMSFQAKHSNKTSTHHSESYNTEKAPDCSIVADGVYPHQSKACAESFWKCNSGVASFLKCPKGLFYCRQTEQCNHRENVLECRSGYGHGKGNKGYGQENTHNTHNSHNHHGTFPAPKPVISETQMSCSGKSDGFYTSAPCTPSYYQCSSEYAFSQICPSKWVFDVPSKSCVHVRRCRKFEGEVLPQDPVTTTSAPTFAPTTTEGFPSSTTQRPTTTRRPSTSTTGAPVTEKPTDDFCQDKADGSYPLDCSSDYYVCAYEFAYKMRCSGNTVFDVELNACDIKSHVAACGGTRPAVAPTTKATIVVKDPFCEGKADGNYANGCSNEYYVCSSEHAYKRTCSPGLVYSIEDDACVYKKHAEACGGKKVADVPVVVEVTRAPDTFCVGKPDGKYAQGCTSSFYVCYKSFANKQECPFGLVFDVEYDQCDNREEVDACGGKKTIPTPSASIPQAPVDSFCNGKSDGYYGLDCSSDYYACVGGFAQKMSCHPGLFYDVTENICLEKDEVKACGGQRRQSTQAPAQEPTAPADTFCNGKGDGYYADGCVDSYYNCEDGSGDKQSCPYGLYFDIEFSLCDYKDNIEVCGGSRTTVAQAPTTPSRPTTAPDTFCQGKADGYHSQGCSNSYYACLAEQATKMNCPDGLFYEIKLNECLIREESESCGGKLTITTTADPSIGVDHGSSDTYCYDKTDGYYVEKCSAMYYNCFANFGAKSYCPDGTVFDTEKEECNFKTEVVACGGSPSPVTTSETFAQAPVDTFCEAKEDGYYALNCSSKYYSCLEEISFQMSCPVGLVYDSKYGQCLTPEEAPTCGGAGPTEFSPAPTDAQAPPVKLDPFCEGKDDDYYSNKCSNWFYNCVSGYGNKIECPSGLVFDTNSRLCEVRKYAVSCGGSARPQLEVQPSKTPLPVDTYCVGRSDGYHALNCSNTYYGCNAGFAQKMACPLATYFDQEVNKCSFKNEVPICGGTRPTDIGQEPASTPIPSVFCQQKKNGRYCDGCQSWFTVCQGNIATRIDCPEGLYYDLENELCDSRSNIAACGGAAPTRPVITTPRPIAKDMCASKADGTYCKGCSSSCIKCESGLSIKLNCESGLFYDVVENKCDHKDLITACGGERLTTTVAPVTTASTLPAFEDLEVGTACNPKRWKKAIGQACGTQFFMCHDRKLIKFVCPREQRFDQRSGLCGMMFQVPWCWKGHGHEFNHHGHQGNGHQHGHNQQSGHNQQNGHGKKTEIGYGKGQNGNKQEYEKSKPQILPRPTEAEITVTESPNNEPVHESVKHVAEYFQNPEQEFKKSVLDIVCKKLSPGLYGKTCSRFFIVCLRSGSPMKMRCSGENERFSFKTHNCQPIEACETCDEFTGNQ